MDDETRKRLETFSPKALDIQLSEEKVDFFNRYTGLSTEELRQKSIELKNKIIENDPNNQSAYWYGFLNIGLDKHPSFQSIKSILDEKTDSKFLDVGFGYGGSFRKLITLDITCQLYGVDHETDLFEYSYDIYQDQDKLDVIIYKLDIADPWFNKKMQDQYGIDEENLFFDVIYCSQYLFMENERLHIALSNIWNILDYDGAFFGYLTGYKEKQEGEDGTYYHSPDSFKRALIENGFIINDFNVSWQGKSKFKDQDDFEYLMQFHCTKDEDYT